MFVIITDTFKIHYFKYLIYHLSAASWRNSADRLIKCLTMWTQVISMKSALLLFWSWIVYKTGQFTVDQISFA